jgi:hypothetical protein
LAALAIELAFIGQGDRRAALCEEAVTLARATGDGDAMAAAALAYFITMPHRLMRAQEMQEAVDTMAAQTTRLLRTRVDQRTVHLLAHVWHGGVLLGEPELIRQSAQELTRLAESRPSPRVLWEVAGRRVMGAIVCGDLDTAERDLEIAACMAADLPEEMTVAGFRAQIAIERGQVAMILPLIESAADTSSSPLLDAMVAYTRALGGDLAGAGQAFDAVLDAGLGRLPDDGTWNFGIALLVETAILLGRTDLGAPLAEALERWPFPHFYIGNSYAGATARLRGNVAHLAGNDDEAMALYEQAITDHQTLGAVPWLAETRLDQAQLCLDRGEPERAAAYARAALDDIGDLPLTRRKNRAVELLAQADQWKDAPHRVLRSSLAANPSSCPGTAAK